MNTPFLQGKIDDEFQGSDKGPSKRLRVKYDDKNRCGIPVGVVRADCVVVS